MVGLGSISGDILIGIDSALRNIDRVESALRGLNKVDVAAGGIDGKNLDQAAKSAKHLEQSLDGVEQSAKRVNLSFQDFKAAGPVFAAIGATLGAAFGLGIKSGADFEAQMSGVAAALGGVDTATGVTKAQFAALQDEALRIGQVTSKSAGEAAVAMELMAKAGTDVETILNGGAQAAVNIAEATGENLSTSAETMSALLNLFKDTGLEASHASDVIVNGMNASSASMSEFQTGVARLAPTILGTGMSFEEAAAAIAYFNAKGFSAAEAGTSLNSAFMRLSNPTDEVTQKMQELGIAAFDANDEFVGFPALFDQVATATAGMGEGTRAAALATIFGADALDVMTLAANNGGDELAALIKQMGTQGTAATASATRMDNLSGSLEQLGGSIETLFISASSALLPGLRSFVDVLTFFVNLVVQLPQPVQAAGLAMTGLGAAVFGAAGFWAFFGDETLAFLKVMKGVPALASTAGRAVLGIGTNARGGVAGVRALTVALRGMAAAHPILAAITVAISLFTLAYTTNFLGIRDLTNKVVSSIGSALGKLLGPVWEFAEGIKVGMQQARTLGLNPLAAAFKILQVGIAWIGGDQTPAWLARIARGLAEASRVAQLFGDRLGQVATGALNVFTGAAKLLGKVLLAVAKAGVGKLFDSIADGVEIVADAAEAFADWFVELEPVADAIDLIERAVGAAMDAIDAGVRTVRDFGRYLRGVADDGNFLGNGLERLSGPIQKVALIVGKSVDAFQDFRRVLGEQGLLNALQIIPERIAQIGDTFGALIGILTGSTRAGQLVESAFQGVANVVAAVVGPLNHLVDTFQLFRRIGMDPLTAAIQALIVVFPNLIGVFRAAETTIRNLGDALREIGGHLQDFAQALLSGDWGAAFSALGAAGSAALDGLVQLFTDLDRLFLEVFESIPWAQIGQTLLTGFQSALAGLQNVAQQALDRVRSAFASVDWGAVWDAITDFGSGLVSKIGDIGTAAYTWVRDKFAAVSWGEAIGELATKLLDKGKELVSGFYKGATDFFRNTVVPGFRNLGTEIVQAVSGVDWLGLLASRGEQLIRGLGNGITAAFGVVVSGLKAIGTELLQAVPGVATFAGYLLDRGEALIDGLWQGIKRIFDTVVIANLRTAGDAIKNAFPSAANLASVLTSAGEALITGLWTGISTIFDTVVVANLRKAGDALRNAFPSASALSSVLTAAGKALIEGFFDGVRDIFDNTVLPNLRTAAEAVKSAFPGVDSWSSLLTDAGEALITGFFDALEGAWDGVITFIGDMATAITDAIPDFGAAAEALTAAVQPIIDVISTVNDAIDSAVDWADQKIQSPWEGDEGGGAAGSTGSGMVLSFAAIDTAQVSAKIDEVKRLLADAEADLIILGTRMADAVRKGFQVAVPWGQDFTPKITALKTELDLAVASLQVYGTRLIDSIRLGMQLSPPLTQDLTPKITALKLELDLAVASMQVYGTRLLDAIRLGMQLAPPLTQDLTPKITALKTELDLAVASMQVLGTRLMDSIRVGITAAPPLTQASDPKLTALKTSVDAVVPSMQVLGTRLMDSVRVGLGAAPPITPPMETQLTNLKTLVDKQVPSMQTLGTRLMDAVRKGLDVAPTLNTPMDSKLTDVKDLLQQNVSSFTTHGTRLMDGTRTGLRDAPSLNPPMETKLTNVKTLLGDNVSSFTTLGTRLADGTRVGIRDAPALTDAMGPKLDALRGQVAGFDLSGEGRSIGISLGQGISLGIQSMVQSVANQAASLVTEAANAAKNAAQIASPSKLFEKDIGIPIGQGVAVGIGKSMGDANAAIAMGLTGVYNEAAKLLNREMGVMGGALLNGWEKLTQGFWRHVATGGVQKGILTEDGSYANPGFYDASKNIEAAVKSVTKPLAAKSFAPILAQNIADKIVLPSGMVNVAADQGLDPDSLDRYGARLTRNGGSASGDGAITVQYTDRRQISISAPSADPRAIRDAVTDDSQDQADYVASRIATERYARRR